MTIGCLEAPKEENKTCFVELKKDGVKMDRKVHVVTVKAAIRRRFHDELLKYLGVQPNMSKQL